MLRPENTRRRARSAGQTRFVAFLLVLAPFLSVGPSIAWCDTVELSGGGRVVGPTKRVEQTKVPYVVVQVDDALRIALPDSRVRRLTESDELAEYRRRASIAAEDPELHYELARWCSANQLSSQSRFHMQRAIALNPDHAQARAALRYVQVDGQWVRYTDLQRSRGMISVGGRWQLPEVVAQKNAAESAEVTAKKWIADVSRLRATVLKGGKGGPEALAKLEAIDDPLVAAAIAKELEDSREPNNRQPRQLRLLWIKLLGKCRNGVSVEALVKAGVLEPDDVIREAALEELKTFGAPSAIATYVPMLKSNNNRDVNQAARALSYFPDPELAFTLVDALITEHKQVKQPGAGMQVGFGDNGGGGMSTGGKPVVIIEKLENRAVLSTLKQIVPDVDFGYQEQRWKDYLASQLLSGYSGDLRRDP